METKGLVTRIHLTTAIEAPLEACFDVCLNVDIQLSLDRGMRAVDGVESGPLRLGDTVTWRARHFGVAWRMTSEIIKVDRPHSFTDQMRRGPFADWRHTHTFQSTETGTRMLDDVEYHAPLGPLGRLFDAAILERYLIGLLRSRNRALKGAAKRAVAPSPSS